MEFKNMLEVFKRTRYEEQLKEIKSIINLDFKVQIGQMVSILSDLITDPKGCIIPVDKDFDGQASSRVIYHLLVGIGISSYNIEFAFLNSSHKYHFENYLNDKYIFVTDTEYGNVTFEKLQNCRVIWIDHHNTNRMKQLKALHTLSYKNGTYLNCKSSRSELVNNLSCGMFTLLFFQCVLENLEVEDSLKESLISKLNEECYLDSSLSLISDEMPTELYSGLLKGTYECNKTETYKSLKGMFDYDNKKYFKSYIAKINNILRMSNYQLLENIIRNNVGHNILTEIERLESDKKMILNSYFKKAKPSHYHECEVTNGIIGMYKLPFSQNETFRNFKGMLASSKIPKVQDKPFIIFSYYTSGNVVNLSCRTNQHIDLLNLIRDNFKLIDSGGHKKSFGIVISSEYLDELFEFCKQLELQTPTNINLIDGTKDKLDLELLKSIALYNEFSKELITISFPKNEFEDVIVEPRRTLYYLKLNNSEEPIKVISFGNSEGNFINAKPRLRNDFKELDFIEICE